MERKISGRIEKLRALMKEREISIYIVPTGDYHQSEYISEYFKGREYITGFTGSAGTAVITMQEACLWTDGRYFIQAEKELEGSGVRLFKSGMDGVPSVSEYVEERINEKDCLGFDGRVMSAQDGLEYLYMAEEHGARLNTSEDLIGELWTDRPPFPMSRAFLLEEKYVGKSTAQKLCEVRERMEAVQADVHVVSDVCDAAWLMNVRGGDISHVPVLLSHLIIEKAGCRWYVNKECLNEEICSYLGKNGVEVKAYDEFYQDVENIAGGRILADFGKINYRTRRHMGGELIEGNNPETLLKAVKNPVEIENIRKAHVKDGVAVVKFMYWLKNTIGKQTITEKEAAEYMDRLRAKQQNFIDISFDTIAAYGANAAMMHYEPDERHSAVLEPKGFLLVDSGGHYLEGSTDITRTFALGEINEEERLMFTAVVRGNLNLANARFLSGCSGKNLDILAREPLWQLGKDYRCGTGHGNGYLLNVHEGPNAFRWKNLPGRIGEPAFQAGMVTTDEPGVYEEGRYGIRIENELLCRESVKNEYGQFLEFENITYAPIDLDAVDPEEMTGREKKLLNDYHRNVYDVISPYLDKAEKEWLREYTREI